MTSKCKTFKEMFKMGIQLMVNPMIKIFWDMKRRLCSNTKNFAEQSPKTNENTVESRTTRVRRKWFELWRHSSCRGLQVLEKDTPSFWTTWVKTLYSSYVVAYREFWVSSKSNIYLLVFFIITLLLRKEINDSIFVYKKDHNQDSKLRKIFEILHYVAEKFEVWSQKPWRDKKVHSN